MVVTVSELPFEQPGPSLALQLDAAGPPIVLHRFGRGRATREYVATEEDALEFSDGFYEGAFLIDAVSGANVTIRENLL